MKRKNKDRKILTENNLAALFNVRESLPTHHQHPTKYTMFPTQVSDQHFTLQKKAQNAN